MILPAVWVLFFTPHSSLFIFLFSFFISQILHPKSYILHPKSYILHPKSYIPHPTSQIPNPTSQIPNPTSYISYPKSHIPNSTSHISHPTSHIPHPTAYCLFYSNGAKSRSSDSANRFILGRFIHSLSETCSASR